MSEINSYSDIFRRDKITEKFQEIDKTIYVEEVALSAANIIAMYTTPVQVVAKKGAGKVIEFISAVVIVDYNSTQFTSGGVVSFREETSATVLSSTIAASVINAAADSITKVTDTAVTLTENKGIFISNATGAFATGNSPVRVKVAYRVHSTGL